MDAVIKTYQVVEIPLTAFPVQLSDDLLGLANGLIWTSNVHGLAFMPKLVLDGAGTGVDVA